ncbi:hypothetical protein [Nocardiopsis sp. LOL_012]|uniref:hypothetical protein n=1 Tax=Nocardiopsis sp. LOL_012 TaxID=3345409 RepID=UPI003A83D391
MEPWRFGDRIEKVLVGPPYLGNVVIRLRDPWCWEYSAGAGKVRCVHRDRLAALVDRVVEDRAGFVPPLPRRPR